MKLLVKKLPFHDKWRNIVQSNKDRNEPTVFSQLVHFVKREAQKAMDPTYGREALKSDAKPNNTSQALQRLKSLKTRMSRDAVFKEDYCILDNVLDKNYAQKFLKNRSTETMFGIPLTMATWQVESSFDCTASFNGISLNSSLLSGPDLTSNLLGVLLRFRQEEIAFLSDIESMYYQVCVPAEDCDYLRFYLWPNGDIDSKPVPYRMLVHLFGATSSPSCATAALQKTADDNNDSYSKDVTDIIRNKFYVDDCLLSVSTKEKAISLVTKLTELCQKGGFWLTKWISNSHDVMETISIVERAKEVRDFDLTKDTLPNERALGVHWALESDNLGFSVKPKDTKLTRIGILSTVSATFDPLGLASPFVMYAKLILQRLCQEDLGWDDEVTGSNLEAWKK